MYNTGPLDSILPDFKAIRARIEHGCIVVDIDDIHIDGDSTAECSKTTILGFDRQYVVWNLKLDEKLNSSAALHKERKNKIK